MFDCCADQIWERRRRIPSATFNDPLDHIFTEFDEDGDGHLTAVEIAHALKSRGVEAEVEQVQEFIDGEFCVAARSAQFQIVVVQESN
jgi:hypothetical protein